MGNGETVTGEGWEREYVRSDPAIEEMVRQATDAALREARGQWKTRPQDGVVADISVRVKLEDPVDAEYEQVD